MATANRQAKKIWHKMSDITTLVFFAVLANGNVWAAIEVFGKERELLNRGEGEIIKKIFADTGWRKAFLDGVATS